MAVSSNDGSTSSTAPAMFLTTSGYVKDMCPRMTRITAAAPSVSPPPQNRARENPRAVVGMINGTLTNASMASADLLPRCLAMCIATGIPNTTSKATATAATRKEVPIDPASSPRSTDAGSARYMKM